MKVAFVTSTGTAIDANFVTSKSFTVWDIEPDEAYIAHTIRIRDEIGGKDDRTAVRADALCDCVIVCAREISGPASAKLVARGIHPLKTGANTPVEEIIGRLQHVLRGPHAPWLRRARFKDLHDDDGDGHDDSRINAAFLRAFRGETP